MANIIEDEKRFVNVGEVCAIKLKDIHPTTFVLQEELGDDIVNFYGTEGISMSNDVTFIKYLGSGFFMDLVSDQLFMTEIFNEDDIGTDQFQRLDAANQNEITKAKQSWISIQNPKNLEEFKESIRAFATNPLVVSITEAPFISINSEVTKKFASQSLDQVKSEILTAKAKAQSGLQRQYNELEGNILNYYCGPEVSSKSKTK